MLTDKTMHYERAPLSRVDATSEMWQRTKVWFVARFIRSDGEKLLWRLYSPTVLVMRHMRLGLGSIVSRGKLLQGKAVGALNQ